MRDMSDGIKLLLGILMMSVGGGVLGYSIGIKKSEKKLV